MASDAQKRVIGGKKWSFSDKLYEKLTQTTVSSEYNPVLSSTIFEFPPFIKDKHVFGLTWETPTFKDIDCNYLFHVYDKVPTDIIISTSSGNTVEGGARAIKAYNETRHKNLKAILIVPELSAFKVSQRVIQQNPHVKLVILRNSTLDSIREVALKLKKALSESFHIAMASEDLKTCAYAQMGLVLNDSNLFDEHTCYVQTVSGGVGPAGVLECARELKKKPTIVVVQPENGTPGPIIDALNAHSRGINPASVLQDGKHATSLLEPTLGSTKPNYALNKLIEWRQTGGTVHAVSITRDFLFHCKDQIMDLLVSRGVYPDPSCGSKYFEIEKSGFIAIAGIMRAASEIQVPNIVINFTGRRPDVNAPDHRPATPHFTFDPKSQDVDRIVEKIVKHVGSI